MTDPGEFGCLLEIFNKYPLEELIIHPRVREEYYKGLPHRESFLYALEHSKNPLCYNGDIWKAEDFELLCQNVAAVADPAAPMHAVMLGRGMIADPSLIRQLKGGEKICIEEIRAFLEKEEHDLQETMSGERPVLFHLKEIWTYLIRSFPGEEKMLKKILKAKKLRDYHDLLNSFL